MKLKTLSVAMYWAQISALISALLAAFELINTNPFVGIILYFLFKEGSEMAMTVAMAQEELNGTDSH